MLKEPSTGRYKVGIAGSGELYSFTAPFVSAPKKIKRLKDQENWFFLVHNSGRDHVSVCETILE